MQSTQETSSLADWQFSHSTAIFASPIFNEENTSCMIGLNFLEELGVNAEFSFVGDRLTTSTGLKIEWLDDDEGQRAAELHRRMPHRVFVVQFDQHGGVSEHDVR